jgi:hypothetical protein
MLSEDDIFEKFPENRKMYDIQALGCHPDYRGRGIATELTRQGFQVKWSQLNEISIKWDQFFQGIQGLFDLNKVSQPKCVAYNSIIW